MSDNRKSVPSSARCKPDLVLPQTKVKTIMKSSPEIENIGMDSLYVITKATELFIDHLALKAYKDKGKTLDYSQLAEVAQKSENLEFLRDIIPVKISARTALYEVAKQNTLANKELLE